MFIGFARFSLYMIIQSKFHCGCYNSFANKTDQITLKEGFTLCSRYPAFCFWVDVFCDFENLNLYALRHCVIHYPPLEFFGLI